MLYNNKPRIIKEGDCDCNEGSKILPQCQLYEPFIGLEKEGKAPEIKYDMRAKHAISTLSSIPIWLNYGKIKAEHLSANREISPFWELASNPATADEILQREFLEILAGAGSRFGMVKNVHLLECTDPLTVKWHSNTSVLELIESFYAQAEKQREQDITFALAARERAMSAVESAQQIATNNSNITGPDLNNLINYIQTTQFAP
jgi:hypothetical protein